MGAPHAKELLPHFDRLSPFMDQFILHMDSLIPKLGTTIPHIDALVTHCGFLLKNFHGLLDVPIVMNAVPALGELLTQRSEAKAQRIRSLTVPPRQGNTNPTPTTNPVVNWFQSKAASPPK